MNRFLTPLKGWQGFAWAAFWGVLAWVLTYGFWDGLFQVAPFMLFLAVAAIISTRSNAIFGVLIAVAGAAAVLLHPSIDVGKMWLPALAMMINAIIIVFLGRGLRQGLQRNQDAKDFRESVGDVVADFLWSVDAKGNPLDMNNRMEAYCGLTVEEIAQQGWEKLVYPKDMEHLMPHFKTTHGGGQKYSWPLRFRHKDGFYRWFQCRAVAIRDSEGRVLKWMGTSTDVHEQRLAEDEREDVLLREKEARIEAETASRMKDEFLATISHELRTPLNAVFGWLKLVRDPEATPEEIQEGLEVIDRNARAQAKLVNDLLDMSGMIKGKIHLNLQPVDIRKVIELTLESAQPMAEAKGVHLRQTLAGEIGLVHGDSARLQQIAWNLLNNAVKFTPSGGFIDVGLSGVGDSAELIVTDTGEGIDPNFLAFVFERFRQADASVTRTHGGLGLGLAITRQLVELHGGSILAESKGSGRGATFRVVLPLMKELPAFATPPVVEARPAAPNGTHLNGARILVIDDDDDTRLVFQQILESHGARTSTATGVLQGMEFLHEEGSEPFAGVICDLAMPHLSGYDFISRLRSFPEDNVRKLPALALTAFARSEDRDQALRAGFDAYLSKPVEPMEMISMLTTLLKRD